MLRVPQVQGNMVQVAGTRAPCDLKFFPSPHIRDERNLTVCTITGRKEGYSIAMLPGERSISAVQAVLLFVPLIQGCGIPLADSHSHHVVLDRLCVILSSGTRRLAQVLHVRI